MPPGCLQGSTARAIQNEWSECTFTQHGSSDFITHKVFLKSFCRSQLLHTSVSLSFAITNMKDKLAYLCGNRLLQNNFMNTFCCAAEIERQKDTELLQRERQPERDRERQGHRDRQRETQSNSGDCTCTQNGSSDCTWRAGADVRGGHGRLTQCMLLISFRRSPPPPKTSNSYFNL